LTTIATNIAIAIAITIALITCTPAKGQGGKY